MLDKAVEVLQLPENGFEAALTTPLSSHTAVRLPFKSETILGKEAPVFERVAAALQFIPIGLTLALINPFSTQAAAALPLPSMAICGSEAAREADERVTGGKDQLILFAITLENNNRVKKVINIFFMNWPH